jgi:histidine triad (HIT) family protein
MTTRRQLLHGAGALALGLAARASTATAATAAPASDPDCVFCRIVAGTLPATIVHRDARCIAFATIEPVEPGHLLLAPVGHVRDIYAMPPDLGGHLFGVATDLARHMKQVFKPDGLTLRQNNEAAGGQTVFHFHMHLVPRFAGREIWRLLQQPQRQSPETLDAVFAPLVAALRASG